MVFHTLLYVLFGLLLKPSNWNLIINLSNNSIFPEESARRFASAAAIIKNSAGINYMAFFTQYIRSVVTASIDYATINTTYRPLHSGVAMFFGVLATNAFSVARSNSTRPSVNNNPRSLWRGYYVVVETNARIENAQI